MMKKKSILMLAAAAAVLCAVICAAGCVGPADEEDEADVLGTWYHGDDKLEVFMTFADDGTGIICCLKDDNGTLKLNVPLPYVNDVLWEAEGDTIYLLFDNGAETSYTIDETTGKLTSQKFGIVYEPVSLCEEDDGISAVWYFEDDKSSEVAIDYNDGTGVSYCVWFNEGKDGKLSDEADGETIFYTYEKKDDGSFDVITDDGTKSHSVLSNQGQTVTNSAGTVYTRMPDTAAAFIRLMAWSAERLISA